MLRATAPSCSREKKASRLFAALMWDSEGSGGIHLVLDPYPTQEPEDCKKSRGHLFSCFQLRIGCKTPNEQMTINICQAGREGADHLAALTSIFTCFC